MDPSYQGNPFCAFLLDIQNEVIEKAVYSTQTPLFFFKSPEKITTQE